MPVYEYACETCGPFTQWRTVENAGRPATCPQCGKSAPKIFPIVNLRALRPEARAAMYRNDRSAHAPALSGCSHEHAKPKLKKADKPVLQFSNKRNSRPWMLGH